MDKSMSDRICEGSSNYNALNGDKAVCALDSKTDRVNLG